MNNKNTQENMFETIISQKESGVSREVLIATYPDMKEDIAFLFDTEKEIVDAFSVSIAPSSIAKLDAQFLVTKDISPRHISMEGKESNISSPYQNRIINHIQKTFAFGIPVLILLVIVIQYTPSEISVFSDKVMTETQGIDAEYTLMNRSSSEKQSGSSTLMTSQESITDASLVDSYIESVYEDMQLEYDFSEDESLDASLVNNDIDTITSYTTNFYDTII